MSSGDDYIIFGSPSIGDEELQEVRATLESCWIGTGPRVKRFEEAFAEYVGAKYAVALNSCTACLHLAMVTAGLEPGDEVITTPMTFAATANAIIHAGGVPVFVDCDRRSMNIDVNQIEAAITPRTRAILPVHFAGRPCDMEAIGRIASRHGLMVIEDAAHCIEGAYHGRKIGTISPITCFSFYVTKNMTTSEGGMICTDDAELAEQVKVYGLHGLSGDAWRRFSDGGYRHYEVVFPGFKNNMTDLAAAIGLCQLPRLVPWLTRRGEIWSQYDEAFADLPCWRPAPPEPGTVHARHLYTLLLDCAAAGLSRDQFMAELHQRGIGTGVHYRALHLHKYYRERFGYKPEDFPNAAWISERTVSLPLSAKLTPEDVDRIVTTVQSVLSKSRRHAPSEPRGQGESI
ncbi:MAG: DegT/DnrJ/EryC1/StrS aminotransferase family protein [Phycisphaerae bacterium]|nr:DegT/DnrJ/EryC1/StrS aminotransferase family protein [Phycisphaerae bacterium]